MAENDRDRGDEHDVQGSLRAFGPTRRRRRALYVVGFVLLVVAVTTGWWVWRPFAPEPSALSVDVSRQLDEAALWAHAASAAVVLADVRADVTGTLRPDEVRSLSFGIMARVRKAVAPLARSEAVSSSDVEARLERFEEALGLAETQATEALDGLLELVTEVGP